MTLRKVRGWVRQREVRLATANLLAIKCAVSHSLHSTLGFYRVFLWQWHHNSETVTSQLLCMCHCPKKNLLAVSLFLSAFSFFVLRFFVIILISFYFLVTFVFIRAAHCSRLYDTGTARLNGWTRYPCVVRSAGFAQCSTSNWQRPSEQPALEAASQSCWTSWQRRFRRQMTGRW